MKKEDPDIVFTWCWFFSFVVGCFLASVLTVLFFPVSTGINSDLQAGLCYFVLSTIFIFMQVYNISNMTAPGKFFLATFIVILLIFVSSYLVAVTPPAVAPTFSVTLFAAPALIRWARQCLLEKLEEDERELVQYIRENGRFFNGEDEIRRTHWFLEDELFRVQAKIDRLKKKLKK